MAKDLVCGCDVDEKSAASHDYKGETYLFCSEECRDKFSESPQDFVK